MVRKTLFIQIIAICLIIFHTSTIYAAANEFERLKVAYPEHIKDVNTHYLTWHDGSRMLIEWNFLPLDILRAKLFKVDPSIGSISKEGYKRDNYEPLFRKMYGNSITEVKAKLTTIYWMPNIFGKKYPLRVTTVNNVHEKLQRVSSALEKLPPSFHKYVAKPASCFYWRNVAKESYLSLHSFGIAMDINVDYSNYWLWDYEKSKGKLTKLENPNRIPMEIVEIFEKEGFAWGGRWYYYDTMHFEYRPELFV